MVAYILCYGIDSLLIPQRRTSKPGAYKGLIPRRLRRFIAVTDTHPALQRE